MQNLPGKGSLGILYCIQGESVPLVETEKKVMLILILGGCSCQPVLRLVLSGPTATCVLCKECAHDDHARCNW